MSEFEHQYLGTDSGVGNVSHANCPTDHAECTNVRSLRYSSPWPWIVAIVISLSMWASVAGLIWVVVR